MAGLIALMNALSPKLKWDDHALNFSPLARTSADKMGNYVLESATEDVILKELDALDDPNGDHHYKPENPHLRAKLDELVKDPSVNRIWPFNPRLAKDLDALDFKFRSASSSSSLTSQNFELCTFNRVIHQVGIFQGDRVEWSMILGDAGEFSKRLVFYPKTKRTSIVRYEIKGRPQNLGFSINLEPDPILLNRFMLTAEPAFASHLPLASDFANPDAELTLSKNPDATMKTSHTHAFEIREYRWSAPNGLAEHVSRLTYALSRHEETGFLLSQAFVINSAKVQGLGTQFVETTGWTSYGGCSHSLQVEPIEKK